MVEINESGMLFGPYKEADFFDIEKSEINIKAGEGIQTVEFILCKTVKSQEHILFIEAKMSSPQQENHENYDCFIEAIVSKFFHSFELQQALILGRYEVTEKQAGDNIKNLDWSRCEIRFVLVIKGHREDWLSPLQVSLDRKLEAYRKIWKCQVAVLNDEMAREKKLIK